VKLHESSATSAPALAGARTATPRSAARAGVIYGVAAYGLWGIFPLYFKAIKDVPTLEVLAHRVIWSLAFLVVLMLWRHNWPAARQALRSRQTLLILCATTLLIGGNWLVFIWAVAQGHVLEASLGYFINPLVNVLLGLIFLHERLRRWQVASVLLATVGVAYLTITLGRFPFLALFLALTFGSYGLLRKIVKVEAMAGLTVETALLAPAAIAFLGYQMVHGQAVFGAASLKLTLLLLSAGFVTAIPLLWFTEAARRLRLATLGFLQYLAPTGHFLCAVLAFREPFSHTHLIAFSFIWTALAIYSIEAAAYSRARYAHLPAIPRPPGDASWTPPSPNH
jgi:chloramphenicol-sensitive protein RarD